MMSPFSSYASPVGQPEVSGPIPGPEYLPKPITITGMWPAYRNSLVTGAECLFFSDLYEIGKPSMTKFRFTARNRPVISEIGWRY